MYCGNRLFDSSYFNKRTKKRKEIVLPASLLYSLYKLLLVQEKVICKS